MKLLPSHGIRHRQARSGSVIVLVVAVLALLAVIGTVYIVSARAQRASATASSVGVNLDLAQQAVNERVADRIGSDMYDATGTVGGYQAAGSGTFGMYMARTWDMPELGTKYLPVIGVSDTNQIMRDQSWLASGIYRPAMLAFNPANNGDNRYNDFSLLTFGGFNPAKGIYDTSALSYITNGPGGLQANLPLFDVVQPNLYASPFTIPTPANGFQPVGSDAFINLLPFSEESGIRYRFGIRIVDTSSLANLNVGSPYASVFPPGTSQLQSENGTYITGYDLTITSPGGNGAPFNSADSGNVLTMTTLNAPLGRVGAYSPITTLNGFNVPPEFAWQNAIMRMDQTRYQGMNGAAAPYDLGEELELRSYGAVGSGMVPRAANLWPSTLTGGAGGAPNFSRDYYTAYSYSRDLRPYPDIFFENAALTAPYFSITAGNTPQTPLGIPPFPARISANPDTSGYNINTPLPIASDEIVNAAVNIANAMHTFGYTDNEARSFAVNYATYRWNSWASTGGATPTFSLPEGPSVLDTTGFCFRNGPAIAFYNTDYTSTLNSQVANAVYVGYAAQPFINEIALTVTPPPPAGTLATISDTAIELYNPYPVAMSLEGFALRIYNGTTLSVSYDFTGKNVYIPANGYFVVALQGSQLLSSAGTLPANAKSISDSATFKFGNSDTTVYLMRKYLPRGKGGTVITAGTWWAAVDQYNVGGATGLIQDALAKAVVPASPPVSEFDARRNADTNTLPNPVHDVWMAAIETVDSEMPQTGTGSLGSPNPTATAKYIDNAPRLYDRFMDHVVADPAPVARRVLDNIGDFNRIMRITNVVNATSGLPIGNLIPAQLASIVTNAGSDINVGNTRFPIEAAMHFDFAGVPTLYANIGATGTGVVVNNVTYNWPNLPAGYAKGPPYPGDTRAVRLLDCLAFTDRVGDYTIDVGDNLTARGLGKIRIPGRINVNTAPAEVLYMLPGFSNPALSGKGKFLIGAILAYRWRTTGSDPRIPAWAQSSATAINFSAYPGYGIRSLAELNTALTDAMMGNAATGTTGLAITPATLDDRDLIWAEIYNYLTVRSDTFAVYAYLEAVKQNPRYGGSFDNSTMWYGNNFTPGGNQNITDDPSDPNIANIPLLRVARRRWVAIIDRSQANFPIGDPRNSKPSIVAQRDLPQ